jgi:tripartite-type tricarboxylate transporter receptor subunit TctC
MPVIVALLGVALAVAIESASWIAMASAADLPKGYPSRPVRLIVPFPPGGSNDILGRFMAAKLTERFGHRQVDQGRPRCQDAGALTSHLCARARHPSWNIF